jgi:TatD DNase family protein
MIDAHCHLDLYDDPHAISREADRTGIKVLAMTNLPSHYEMGFEHVQQYKNIRLALGMHPLYAQEHEAEFPLFIKNLHRTSYIGEVGMDFSREGIGTKAVQMSSFSRILDEIKGKKKIISIHSRRAEQEILKLLIEKQTTAGIFHWYSGPLGLIDKIGQAGFFFSVNPMMTRSPNGKKIIARIPREKVLSETDGPFTSINGHVLKPKDCIQVIDYLSNIWQIDTLAVESQIKENFRKLLSLIR